MAASYPSAAKSFTPIVDGTDYPQADDVNSAYDEITAIESALLSTGLAHHLFPDATTRTLGTSSKYWGLSYLKALSLADATELTISSGAVVVTQGYHKIDTEGDAATDDLATLTATGLTAGFIVILRAENTSRVVTLKDGTGNLLLNGDYDLSATDRTITLIYDGTNWREVCRSVSLATTGTWTPVIGGSGGTSGQSYTTQAGRYTKTDRLVVCEFNVVLSTAGTITSAVQLQGLPFTPGALAECHIPFFENMATNWITLGGIWSGSGTNITIYGRASAGATSASLTSSDIGNTTGWKGTVTFSV